MSQVISSFLLLPHELKHRGTKKGILNILKVAHDKFNWNGREIPQIGIYGGCFGKPGLKDFGCTSSIPA